MGLCKCPKRKVTNLFCFEHRVNVCEHCLVANHEKCIVKSYLQWLQDSDYNPICSLCNRSLSDEDCGECIRLTCYDVFHWLCLNQHCQQLPSNTAPAGYTCPTCNTCVFPPANLATPVAEAMRRLLQQVNWARAGLGLPLIDEPNLPPPPAPGRLENDSALMTSTPLKGDNSQGATPATGNFNRPSAQVPPYSANPTPHAQGGGHSVINVDEGTSARQFSHPRKLFDSTKDDGLFNQSHDHDDDKYKRRPAFQWLAQWFKSRDGSKKRDPSAIRKRFFMVLIIGIVTFITLVIIFSQLGRNAADDDPFLDPMNNPNIKVEQKVMEIQG
ncbi:zinc finger protein-like 1 [Littorina saxatilis]|uniref:RING-type domain-containing protein n=1 Tax=Littorina saxatilis TaxID=31220 RepID=A0AAN9BFW2_9CAEN